jgi:hypothetical protein
VKAPNEHSFPRLEFLGQLPVSDSVVMSSFSEKQLDDIRRATQVAEQQASQQYFEQPLPPSPSHPSSGAGDMTYATVNSEDQPPAKGKGKATVVVKKTAAGVAAAKKQALSKKKQREVSSQWHVGCTEADG